MNMYRWFRKQPDKLVTLRADEIERNGHVLHPLLLYLTYRLYSMHSPKPEQQTQAYRWGKDTVSSAVVSKGVNALSNRYPALQKKISMNTKGIMNICEELKEVKIKV